MAKKALLIGNKEYHTMSKLNLPEKDVAKLKSILQLIGFQVTDYCNIEFEKMDKVIKDFGNSVNDNDEIIFYFSGHGYHFEGNNYIAPIDCLNYSDVNYYDAWRTSYSSAARVIDITLVIDVLKRNENGINILLLDSCRNIVETKMYNDKRISGLLEIPVSEKNFFISFATSLEKFAEEKSIEDCSIYVNAISKTIFRKSHTIDQMFHCVTDYVCNNCSDEQRLVLV